MIRRRLGSLARWRPRKRKQANTCRFGLCAWLPLGLASAARLAETTPEIAWFWLAGDEIRVHVIRPRARPGKPGAATLPAAPRRPLAAPSWRPDSPAGICGALGSPGRRDPRSRDCARSQLSCHSHASTGVQRSPRRAAEHRRRAGLLRTVNPGS